MSKTCVTFWITFLSGLVLMQLYLVYAFSAIWSFFVVIDCEVSNLAVPRLYPEETLFGQVLRHEKSAIYKINDLQESVTYEVRISYPAVIPTDFVIEVSETFLERKLLNVEQLQFLAKSKSYIIKVTAYRTGLPIVVERLSDPVPFNIIVNRLYYGCSISSWKMIGVCLSAFVLVIGFGVPYVLTVFLRVMDEDDVKKIH